MGRPTAYLLLICGIPLGYTFSYFFQPEFLRILVTLPEYLREFPLVLWNNRGLERNIPATAVLGISFGVLVMLIVVFLSLGRKPAARASSQPVREEESGV